MDQAVDGGTLRWCGSGGAGMIILDQSGNVRANLVYDVVRRAAVEVRAAAKSAGVWVAPEAGHVEESDGGAGEDDQAGDGCDGAAHCRPLFGLGAVVVFLNAASTDQRSAGSWR